jgi:NhaP-type Na+/H+ and K+/H+ antiporter
MISLLIQGWTVAPVARWLKLGAPPDEKDQARSIRAA